MANMLSRGGGYTPPPAPEEYVGADLGGYGYIPPQPAYAAEPVPPMSYPPQPAYTAEPVAYPPQPAYTAEPIPPQAMRHMTLPENDRWRSASSPPVMDDAVAKGYRYPSPPSTPPWGGVALDQQTANQYAVGDPYSTQQSGAMQGVPYEQPTMASQAWYGGSDMAPPLRRATPPRWKPSSRAA